MPIIINNSTGLAENLDQDAAQSSLQSGSHSLPMIDPQGQHVSVSFEQAQDALTQGFRQPDSVELQNLHNYAKYSTPEQQLATALEGAGSALTFGTSTGAETGMGVDPESIRLRRQVNPGMHALGEAGGILGGMLTGTGEAQLMELAGAELAAKIGISGATLAGRAATTGIKQFAEMALYQAGDEVSKAFTHDPEQSISSAILDTGLAAASGAALGAGGHFVVGGLWNATVGPKLEKILQASKREAENIPAITEIAQKAEKAGIELDDVMRGALTPEGREAFRDLQMLEGTRAGKVVNESLDNLRNQAEEGVLNVFGKTKDSLEKSSDAELGEKLLSVINDKLKPIAEKAHAPFEELNGIDKELVINPAARAAINRNLAEFAVENSFPLAKEKESAIFSQLEKRLSESKTMDQAKKSLGEAAAKSGSTELKEVSKALRDGLEDTLYDIFEKEGLAKKTTEARASYSLAKTVLEPLSEKFGINLRGVSPKAFLEELNSIAPEKIIEKFGNRKDVSLLDYLKTNFKEGEDLVREYHKNRIPLKELANKRLNIDEIFKKIADPKIMPKEIKDFAFTPEEQEKLLAIKDLIRSIPPSKGRSGTPEGMRVILKNLFTAIGGVAGFATGRTVAGLLLGKGAQVLSEEVPQAMRLSYLKMLGGNESVSAKGFNAMFKAAMASARGTELLNKTVGNLFKESGPALASSYFPTARSLNLLHSSMLSMREDPTKAENVTGDLSHYLPNQSIALSTTTARAANYLATLQPNEGKMGMLDKPRQPSEMEKTKYNRALTIVQQPLVILQHVKDGTITPEDMKTFSTVYPSLVNSFRQKIVSQMTEHIAKGKEIPYKTRIGLTLFLGQPLESSIAPQNILSNQALFAPPVPQAPAVKSPPSGGFKASFSKLSNIYATPGQLRERQKSNR